MAVVVRDRLTRMLRESPARVALISARPGFGKSVAIRQLRESLNARTLHYEVRARSFVPFVRGLVESAAPFAPALQASFAGAIETAMQSSKPHDEIALWVLDHLRDAKIEAIAIEDLHRIASDERARSFLLRLVKDSPSHIRWIFAARERSALAESELLAARIDFSHVGEDDLRLTLAEAMQIAKPKLRKREVARLFQLTGGQPAAYHFAVHVFDGEEPLDGSAYEFYAGRYFDRCAPNLRELLLGVCVLDEVDQELLLHSPWAASAHEVPALAAQGLVFAARGGGRYRLHEPFRALLQARLGAAEVRSDAQRAGALMLEARGRPAAALELYLKAQDAPNVLRMCERYGFDLADQGHLDLLRRSLASVDEGEVHKSATLLALLAIAESLAGRTDTAESWYLHALRIAGDPRLRATISYRYAIDLIRQGRPESVDLLEPYVTQTPVDGELAAHIHSTLATAYVVAARFDDAREAMQRALQFTAGSDSVSLHAAIAHQAAWVALFTGDIPQAKQRALRAVELALSSGVYDVAARAYSVLYSITYELEDDARAALTILNNIWDCGLKAGDLRMRLYALVGSFDIAAELGDTQALARMERTMQAHEVDYADPFISQAFLPAEALRLAAAGDFEEAFRLLSPTAERQITDDRRALRFAEIALYAAAAGHVAEARAAIAQVLVRFDRLEAKIRRTQRTNAILAVALYLVGRRSDAAARLRELAAAEQHASLRIRMLTQTLEVLFANWDGADNFTRVLDALQTLRSSDFGGIAAVLAALPCKIAVSA